MLLDPTWLFDIMQNIVELKSSRSIKNKLTRQLDDTGIAPKDLLLKCWEKYLREPIEASFYQMRLMMQAEGLIHPIKRVSESTEPSDEKSTPQEKSLTAAANEKKLQYLIPCKLPDKSKEEMVNCTGWITFYFDFKQFLPEEIFHRLICKMLAISQACPSFDNPYLSKNVCQFNNIDDCLWTVELEGQSQRLKISVLYVA